MTLERDIVAGARRLLHVGALGACLPAAYAFERALGNPRGAQEARLADVLDRVDGTSLADRYRLSRRMSPEKFRAHVPETRYDDYAAMIAEQRDGARSVLTRAACDRYQPTSGSSAKVKWVPYTKGLLDEFDAAISPWACDMYRVAPGARRGRHYWSLSWLPTHLRAATASNVNDDRALLSWEKRLFSALGSPVPGDVAYAATSEESAFATLAHLCAADDLSVISVWSPTFALNLFEVLAEQRDAIAAVLDEGRWDAAHAGIAGPAPRSLRAAQLLRSWDRKQDPAFYEELWPMLAFVSAWDTSTSKRWADRLSELLPQAHFQGKGLWSTEGVVTLPFRGRFPLAIRSHFLEFVDLQDDTPYFAWELREGQHVRPLLTTSSGLLRYALSDHLVVRGRLHETPCLEFLGRIGDVDLVGEKTSPETANAALDALGSSATCRPVSLLALSGAVAADGAASEKPRYVALCEGPASHDEDVERSERLERAMREVFHYALARDLGQLEDATVLTLPNARALYEDLGVARGMVRGNIKIEPLFACLDERSLALVGAHLPSRRAPHATRTIERRT